MSGMKKISFGVAILVTAMTLSACASANTGGTTTGQGQTTVYPYTVENYSVPDGGAWKLKEQTFNQSPERVVANTQGVAELLIQLGLTEKVVGVAAVYGEVDPELATDFAKIPVLSNDYVGKELVIGTNPDLVMGRGDLFADADWGVGTVDGLNDMGINTFIQNTCYNGAVLDDVYKDIEQLGAIFDVQENAATFSESLRERESALKTSLAGETNMLKYAFLSSVEGNTLSVYSASGDTYVNDALKVLKMENAYANEVGEISVETLIATNPDVLMMSTYTGGPDANKMVADLYANPALQSMNAIKNKQVYVIDFNEFWTCGYQIIGGLEKLGAQIYPDILGKQ